MVQWRHPLLLLRDETRATAAEYALIVGAIVGVLGIIAVVVLYAFGAKVNNLYGKAVW